VNCKKCGAAVDVTMGACPACAAPVELGRLTGILGVVCRACDAYNEPRAKTCVGCGKPLGSAAQEPAGQPAAAATAATRPAAPAGPAAPPAPSTKPAAPAAGATAAPPPGPVVRSFQKAPGAATRFVPAVLRPSAEAKPGSPALTPIPLVTTCPRCGAEAGRGRFCAQCGQALGARGTQVMMRPPAAGRTSTQVLGAAAPPPRAKLVLEGGGGAVGAAFPLDGEVVEAGRARGAIVFPDDPCLAAHHATFLFEGGVLHVRDEGAPGGIYLRLRGLSVPLRAGDHFVVGERLLRYAGLLPSPATPPPDGTVRLGAPRPAQPALVVEEWLEGGAGGRVFVRSGPSLTIGRAGCAVSLGDDPHVSQSHAEIVLDREGTARLRDLGSSNGTYVKVPPHGERELRDGDLVRMGREVLRVALEG
jgi:pSer/pThr/pTyr-binding forkhead associated (FHA) protein